MLKLSKYVWHAIGKSQPFGQENLFSPKKHLKTAFFCGQIWASPHFGKIWRNLTIQAIWDCKKFYPTIFKVKKNNQRMLGVSKKYPTQVWDWKCITTGRGVPSAIPTWAQRSCGEYHLCSDSWKKERKEDDNIKRRQRWRKFSWCSILSSGHGTLSKTSWRSGWDPVDWTRCLLLNPEFPFSFPRCERRHGLV